MMEKTAKRRRSRSSPAGIALEVGGLFTLTTAATFMVLVHMKGAGSVPGPQTNAVATGSVATIANKVASSPVRNLVVTMHQAQYLVRSTLKSLGDALATGNFTVLRDLAGPSFRSRNSDAELALRFERLASAGPNLTAAAVAAPTIASVQQIAGTEMVALSGHVMTARSKVNFRIVLEPVRGRWVMADLAVETAGPAVAAASLDVASDGQGTP